MNNAGNILQLAASGLGRDRTFDWTEVGLAAASLMTPRRAHFERDRYTTLLEQWAHMGSGLGPIHGHEEDERWAAIGLEMDDSLLDALSPIVSRRGGRTCRFTKAGEIMPFWRRERKQGLRAICVVGQSIPWQTQEALQLDGAFVARLPFTDPSILLAYAEKAASLERERERERERDEGERNGLPKVAWIVTPTPDRFTEHLDILFSEPLEQILAKCGFSVTRVSGGSSPVESLPSPGFVLLLTHGGDPPNTGAPLGLSADHEAALARACEAGAVITHLGCNGAGLSAGGRFGALADRLGLEGYARPERDTFSTFGRTCLERGAAAVLAHVDSTWSSAFDHAQPVVDWTGRLCSGTGAFGYAADSLAVEAARAGASAYEHLLNGCDAEAGMAWLRHLDLRGFVILGDPSAYCAWL